MNVICNKCQNLFEVLPEDLQFYDRVSPVFNGVKYPIPAPTLCSLCRRQRRYAWRNEFTYYRRKCDKCQKDIVSVYDPQKPYVVYCSDCYLKRDWDVFSYGPDFPLPDSESVSVIDVSKTFFAQFSELYSAVPHITMVNDNGLGSENCEYTFNFVYGKNCYLVSTTWYAENCFYVSKSGRLLDVIDCDNVSESELVHECVSSNKLYNCQYIEDSQNCNNCIFGKDLRGCSDCFGCIGLVQKSYCIFNEQFSPEEYKQKISAINLGSQKEIDHWKEQYEMFTKKFPKKASSLLNCENCLGDRLVNCRNTIGFGIWNGENVKYEDFGDTPKNSYDILIAGLCEWCYESQVPDNSYMACFTNYCWSCNEVFYSDDCRYCKNCFGCVGLRQAQYCVLNKQYTKEEYEELVPRIIESMKGTFIVDRLSKDEDPINFMNDKRQTITEYGEFFPASLSPFGYNETVAQDYLPLNSSEAKIQNFNWKDEVSKAKNTSGKKPLEKNIQEVQITDIAEIFSCTFCENPYKIPPEELQLRKKLVTPFPARCPACRRLERTKMMNPTKLYERNCDKCGEGVVSRYSSNVEGVWCQKCYVEI